MILDINVLGAAMIDRVPRHLNTRLVVFTNHELRFFLVGSECGGVVITKFLSDPDSTLIAPRLPTNGGGTPNRALVAFLTFCTRRMGSYALLG